MEQDFLLRHMMHDKNDYGSYTFSNNTYPWECMDSNCEMKPKMMEYNMNYMPIQNMGSKIYGYIYQTVIVVMNKHMVESNKMPKAIAKDKFNLIVNDCMGYLTKNENELKNMLKTRCIEHETEDRVFCPFCGGMLKSIVEIALISSLINRGCAYCY